MANFFGLIIGWTVLLFGWVVDIALIWIAYQIAYAVSNSVPLSCLAALYVLAKMLIMAAAKE